MHRRKTDLLLHLPLVQNIEFCQIRLFSKEPKHNRHNFYFCVLLLLSICKTHFCSDAPVQECLRLGVFSKPRRLVSGPQSNSDLWEIFSQLFPITWWFCVCSKGERIGGLSAVSECESLEERLTERTSNLLQTQVGEKSTVYQTSYVWNVACGNRCDVSPTSTRIEDISCYVDIVAKDEPKRQACTASHCSSKPQRRSPDEITLVFACSRHSHIGAVLGAHPVFLSWKAAHLFAGGLNARYQLSWALRLGSAIFRKIREMPEMCNEMFPIHIHSVVSWSGCPGNNTRIAFL